MKTKEELNALKEEVENLNEKLRELTEEELAEVCGGAENNSTIGKDDDVVWLYENDAQSKGSSTWYGISNSESKTEN